MRALHAGKVIAVVVAFGVGLVLLHGAGWNVFAHQESDAFSYRKALIDTGPIVTAVQAAGTVNPVVTVVVGSQLSGQIKELRADFNSVVMKGQILALLDAEQILARMEQARANLLSAEAALEEQRAMADRARADLDSARANLANARAQANRAEALAKDAERDFHRKRELSSRGSGSTAETERAQTSFDAARAQHLGSRAQEEQASAIARSAEAAIRVAEAKVAQAEAQVRQRKAAVQQVQVDLDNCEIRSPIDGVVIQRSVDVGQTVAASFQAPTLFTIAQDLKHIEVWASVDEGDVGRVAPGQEATFTVPAYPGTTFHGTVQQVRLGPQTVQNVVTYIVVIAAANSEMKLKPGMTASVRIIAVKRDLALRVPNIALRYRPPGVAYQSVVIPFDNFGNGSDDEFVRALSNELALSSDQQRQLGDVVAGTAARIQDLRRSALPSAQFRDRVQSLRQGAGERIRAILTADQQRRYAELAAEESAGSASRAGRGRVWVLDASGNPSAVSVRLGVSDGSTTELLGGNLTPGQTVIVGGGRTAREPTDSQSRL